MQLEATLGRFGPAVLFLAALVETCGLPIPSEATLVLAGSLSGAGHFPLWHGVLATATGGALGAGVSYWLGRRAGTGWLLRAGRRAGLREEHLRLAEAWLHRRGHWALLLGRFAPFVRALIGYPAGMAGAPFPRYLVLSVLGYTAWATASQVAGYLLGEHWYLVLRYTEEAGWALAVLGAGWLLWRWRRRRRSSHPRP